MVVNSCHCWHECGRNLFRGIAKLDSNCLTLIMNSQELGAAEANTADLIKPELLKKAFKTLEGGLNAEKRVRGKQRGSYEDVADHAIRLKAADSLIAYCIGRPTQTTKNLNLNLIGSTDKKEMKPSEVVQSMINGGVDFNKLLKETVLVTQAAEVENELGASSIDI